MRRQKRPYFPIVVFLTLLAFGLFLAWQSSTLSQELAGPDRGGASGRTLYLPALGKHTCAPFSCPPSSPPTPYPAELEIFTPYASLILTPNQSFWWEIKPDK